MAETENNQGELFETDEVSSIQDSDELDAPSVVALYKVSLVVQRTLGLLMRTDGFVPTETIEVYIIQMYSSQKLKSLVYLLK